MFCTCNVSVNLYIVRVPVKSRAWSFPLHLINMRNTEYTSGGWVCLVTQICDYSFFVIKDLKNGGGFAL
jgi:hypothetical protein